MNEAARAAGQSITAQEFIERIVKAFQEFGRAVKRIFEKIAKHFQKSSPIEKSRKRFGVIKGMNPAKFIIQLFGRRHKPP